MQSRKTILVVEDEVDIREAIVAALTQADFHVVSAEDGKEGLAKAFEHEPDLILLDLLMPVMGGQEVLAKLRESAWGEHAKVVVLTAVDDVKNMGSAYEANIVDYIPKTDTSLAEIIQKVQAILAA